MKLNNMLAALTMVLLFTVFGLGQALAVQVDDNCTAPFAGTINVFTNPDGSFADLKYVISSTGATSGIRYRTTGITFAIGGYSGTIDMESLMGIKPGPGQTQTSVITINASDILNTLQVPPDQQAGVLQQLNTPGKLSIGAVIQIFNANTGDVLATIDNENQIDSVAGQFGFGSQDISDMHSRFQGGEITAQPQSQPGNGTLILQAISQDGQTTRSAGTAKWTDNVTATLKVPEPVPPRGTLDWWQVQSANLLVPQKNPNFTFGTPYDPNSTDNKTIAMTPSGQATPDNPSGTQATGNFPEDWSMDGANVFSVIENQNMAVSPKNFPITANYTIYYQYHYTVCDPDGCETITATGTENGSAGANLLVNGSGVNSRAQ